MALKVYYKESENGRITYSWADCILPSKLGPNRIRLEWSGEYQDIFLQLVVKIVEEDLQQGILNIQSNEYLVYYIFETDEVIITTVKKFQLATNTIKVLAREVFRDKSLELCRKEARKISKASDSIITEII